ncbi:MAG: N-formylglutamate amidohydrolase [Planctomycetota bacterium]|jgi:predicted N-formylglutamate amidohydrolase
MGGIRSVPRAVVSVEHASFRVPKHLEHLGLPPAWLETHHGWDPGAALVGRLLARALVVPLHLARWSRLVADVNRSAFHQRVVPATTGGRRVPANQDLDLRDRRERVARYWQPYRDAVESDLDRAVATHGKVLHISVHSFVERLRGRERRHQLGLLYNPARRLERAMADRLDRRLTAAGYCVRRNQPYSGLEDGFCMRMRAERKASCYLGMEIEMNQRWVRKDAVAKRFAADLIAAFKAETRYCGA